MHAEKTAVRVPARLLISFEPFGPHRVNPSELLFRSFEGRIIAGQAIGVRVFPVETRPLRARLEAALREEGPAIVLGVGYAPGRAALALERAALNVLDFPLADNSGTMPKASRSPPAAPTRASRPCR